MRIWSILVSMIICHSLLGQNDTSTLKIGDKCPDAIMGQIINYHKPTARVSDFKGKWLILDFWATWCMPCVRLFPKIDSLQQAFKMDLIIMPVTYQDRKTVSLLLDKLQPNKRIPSVVSDSVFHKLFRFHYLPHYVWIDPSGTIRAFTGPEEITYHKINSAIRENAVQLTEKKDFRLEIDKTKPFVANTHMVNSDNLLYQSALTGYIDGLGSGHSFEDSTRITARNTSILWLYKDAAILTFGDSQEDSRRNMAYHFMNNNRVFLDVKDSSILTSRFLRGEELKEWKYNYSYCYQLIVPPSLSRKRGEIMFNELNNIFGKLFGISARIEKKMVKTLILKRLETGDIPITKGGKPTRLENPLYFKLINLPLSELMLSLSTKYMQSVSFPLIDDTGFKSNVDIEINANLSSIDEVNASLAKFGLRFAIEYKELEMIVIKQSNDTR